MENSTNWSAEKKLAEGRNMLAAGRPTAARFHLMCAANRMGADKDLTRTLSPEALLDLIATIEKETA